MRKRHRTTEPKGPPEICTYCIDQASTSDHVPPKLLFSKPRPALITVPSCLRCNQAPSKDDEYLRAVIVLEEKALDHPEAKRVLPAVRRSFLKPRKQRFRRAIFSGVREVERVSASGLYLGKGHAYDVDLSRLTRVIERITRGLFLHHVGRRLPLDCEVVSFAESGFSSYPANLTSFLEQIRSNPIHTIGDDHVPGRYLSTRRRGSPTASGSFPPHSSMAAHQCEYSTTRRPTQYPTLAWTIDTTSPRHGAPARPSARSSRGCYCFC